MTTEGRLKVLQWTGLAALLLAVALAGTQPPGLVVLAPLLGAVAIGCWAALIVIPIRQRRRQAGTDSKR